MTTYAADTFTRSNGPVGNAETGGAWTTAGSPATWAVVSHQLTGRSTTGYDALLTVDDGQSDGAVQATFVGGNASAGLVFRCTSGNDYWVLTFGDTKYIRLNYLNDGYTVKADPGAVAAAGDVFRIELTGPGIVIYRNNVQMISLTDSTSVTATSHGFLTAGTGTSTFDNFSHSSLAQSPPPTPPAPPPTPPTATVHRFFNIGGIAVPVT